MQSFSLRTLAAALMAGGLLVACGGGGEGGSDTNGQATVVDLTRGPQTYRLASQFGTPVALTMDTGAGTFSYSSGNVKMSGTLRASSNGTYLLNTGISASNMQTELQLKDGAIGGALQLTSPVTGSLSMAIVAGANEKLIVKTTEKIAARYASKSINTSSCNADRTSCGDFSFAPDTVRKESSTDIRMTQCEVPQGATVQTVLSLDGAACPAVVGGPSTKGNTWKMNADGDIVGISPGATSSAFFADFGGKVVGFMSLGVPRTSTMGGGGYLTVYLPISQPTQAAELNGQWNFVSKDDRLSVQINSLSDARVYKTGQPASSGEALGPIVLNQWGNGINTVMTGSTPADLAPVFVAGPWAALHISENGTNYVGLKR